MNKDATAQLHIYSAFFVLAGFVLNRGVFLLFLAEKGMSVTGNRALSSPVQHRNGRPRATNRAGRRFLWKEVFDSSGRAAAFLPYSWHAVAFRPFSRRAFPC